MWLFSSGLFLIIYYFNVALWLHSQNSSSGSSILVALEVKAGEFDHALTNSFFFFIVYLLEFELNLGESGLDIYVFTWVIMRFIFFCC